MTEHVVIYKVITLTDIFEFGDNAKLGDIAVRVVDRNELPIGWTQLSVKLIDFRLEPFNKEKPLPAFLFSEESGSQIRVELAVGQKWLPKINCRTHAPKIIKFIQPDEIHYTWSNEHVWCETESFYEWIIYTQAFLVVEGIKT